MWTKANGDVTEFQNLSQQHLTNIFWFYKIFREYIQYDEEFCEEVVESAQKQINMRFNGVFLDWRPEYPFEIHALDKMNLLDKPFILNFNGEKIGRV